MTSATTTAAGYGEPYDVFPVVTVNGVPYYSDNTDMEEYWHGNEIYGAIIDGYAPSGQYVQELVIYYEINGFTSPYREYILVYFPSKDKYYRYSRPK